MSTCTPSDGNRVRFGSVRRSYRQVAPHRTIRDAEILGLWFQRPEDKRTGLDMIDFFHWLEQHRPDLVLSGPSLDPFQPIKALIQAHTKGDA